MKIGQKLILGFVGIALLVGVVGYISLNQLSKIAQPLNVDIPKSIKEIIETSHLDGLAQFIRYYDEVLTQSARNYAFTQDKKWEQRYRGVEPKLYKIIKEAIEKGDEKDKEFFSSVDKANLALVDMEYKSIELINNGQVEQAVKILESGEYWDQKVIYEQSFRDYVFRRGAKYDEALESSTKTIDLVTKQTQNLIKASRQLVALLAVVVFLLAIGIGILISRSISNPLAKLKDAVIEIGKGKLDTRVDIKSKDEIGFLATSFNKMAEDLSGAMEKEKQLAVVVADAERKRVAELEEAYKKLEEMQYMLIQVEKLEAVGQLASGIAHEVKNPLGIIIQGVNYLERHVPQEKGISEIIDMIKTNIKRADNIIRILVDFSRATRLKCQPQDINSILEDSLVLIQHMVKLKQIEIIKEMKEDLPKTLVDKGKMEQVFVNIFLNSIQAMPNGGKLFIRSYLTQLNEPKNGIGRKNGNRFKLGERAIKIEIEDTGVGISKEDLKRTFDPFFTTKGPHDGVGLGLSVTRNIIDMHNGSIQIKSEKGKGTKVIIVLKISGGR